MFRKDLENILKDKYAAQQSDLDHDALWSRVYPEIKKDRKRPFIFWISGISILILGLWILMDVDTREIIAEQSVRSNQSTISSDKDSSKSPIEDGNTDQGKNMETSAEDYKTAASINEEESNMSYDLSKDVTLITSPPTSMSYLRENVNVTDEMSVSNSDHIESVSSLTDSGNGLMTSLVPSSVNNNKYSDVSNQSTKIKSIESIDNLALKSFLVNVERTDLAFVLMPTPIEQMACIDKFKHWKFMDVIVGYGKVTSNLSATDLSAESALVMRINTENALDVLSLDLLWGYAFTDHWGLKSGVDYQVITDRIMHSFEKSEIISGDSVLLETKRDKDGMVSNVFGEGDELLVTSTLKTRYNHYHSIGLPITLVFNNELGPLSFELGAGVRLSRLFRTSGYIQDTENTEYDLSVDTDKQYGRSINTEILLDAGVVYNLSKRLGWRTGLQYRYGLDGLNSSLNPIAQKYNLIKITTGLRYQF